MKALVLGATGIIGNNLIRYLLKEGVEVRAVSRGVTPSLNLKGLDIEYSQGDIHEASFLKKAVRDCSLVFHTAPYYPLHPFHLKQHEEKALSGLRTVLEVLKGSSINKLVYTSTLTTIGRPAKEGEMADETCSYHLKEIPHPYFWVKHLMEEEVRSEAGKGFPIVIVNPTGCFGPFELKPPQLCLIPQLMNKKLPAYIEGKINAVSIYDVARGHWLASQKGRSGERYILGGHNMTSGDLIRLICKIGKVAPPKFKIPTPLAAQLAKIVEAISYYGFQKPSPMSLLGIRFIQYGQHLNSQKAIHTLGYSISPLDPAIKDAIEWFESIKYF